MAPSRSSTVQSLSIALMVFVMLTFILAVTTYYFFTQKEDEIRRVRDATAATEEVTRKLNQALDEKAELQKVIGFEPEQSIDEVTAGTTQTLDTQYGDYLKDDPRSYEQLVKRLKESADEKDKAVAAVEQEKRELQTRLDAEVKDRDERITALTAEVQETKFDAEGKLKALNQKIGELEDERRKVAAEYDGALGRSAEYDRLQSEVAKAENLLSLRRRSEFKGQSAEKRVAAMMDELRDRERAIQRANEVLAKLRAADPAVQEAVNQATPKDDRIDGFDGRIISVNDVDRTVLILSDSTRGVRPGLLLFVYDPADPTPAFDNSKGTVEVIAVESPTLARARIRTESAQDPLLGGDGVATTLWTPGTTFEVTLLGFVQIDNDARPDADRLEELVKSLGGTVAPSVSSQTTLVVDAGTPKLVGSERPPGWRPADDQRRERQLTEARRLGLKIIGLDRFLQLLGIERDSLDGDRLPTVGIGAAAAR